MGKEKGRGGLGRKQAGGVFWAEGKEEKEKKKRGWAGLERERKKGFPFFFKNLIQTNSN